MKKNKIKYPAFFLTPDQYVKGSYYCSIFAVIFKVDWDGLEALPFYVYRSRFFKLMDYFPCFNFL